MTDILDAPVATSHSGKFRFDCDRDNLLEALGIAGRATGRPGMPPVLSGIRLDLDQGLLTATGTDTDLTISVRTPTTSKTSGAVVVPGRLATDIVKALEPGSVVTVDVDDDQAKITSGRSEFNVRTFPAGDFPKTVRPSGEPFTLSDDDFGDALRQVVKSASTDDARPVLTGVLVAPEGNGVRLVATDSYRLAVRDLDGVGAVTDDNKVLIPSRCLSEVRRVMTPGGTVDFRLGDHEASFEASGVTFTTRLIEGEYPDYRQLIPDSLPYKVTVGRGPLIEAAKRVRLVASETSTPVRLAISADGIELSAVSTDTGNATEEVDADYQGDDMTVAFNPGYLLDGLEAFTGDHVDLELADPLKPATIRQPGSPEFLYLLMPVRV